MSEKSIYLKRLQKLLYTYFAASKIPLSILDRKNKTIFCLPTCDDNTWPSKNNQIALDNFYDISQINDPTLLILEDVYYLGIIPIEFDLFIYIGPVMPHLYTLAELLVNLSDIYTENEIITYYHVNSECGFMDNIRFSNIISILCGLLLRKTYYAEDLLKNRIVIEKLPLLEPKARPIKENLEASTAYIIDTEKAFLFSVKCDRFILSHLREKITAADLATAVNVSERTLYRQFNEDFNMTPNDYIHYKKVSKSLEMLLQTNMTISEISSYWGYSSQSHYNKAFEKVFKMPPGEYRKANR